MGKFIYGDNVVEVEIEDRTLAHLKIAIFSKLRRNESFSFSWQVDADSGSGRHSIWLSPSAMVHFHFYGNRPPSLNRAWLKMMVSSANEGDLRLMDEPSDAEVDLGTVTTQARW